MKKLLMTLTLVATFSLLTGCANNCCSGYTNTFDNCCSNNAFIGNWY